jgi:prepilin-type N-terminal cleavage/methylation domain-containing protein
MDRRRAFTLIELLTGLAIIALLIAMLFPAISRAQQSARLAQCASNIRQLCQGVFLYAADFGGKLPPNTSSPAMWWYDPDRIGKYIKASGVPAGEPGGPVYTCPNDDGNLSYSMNVWASCKVDADVLSYKPPTGALWLENHLLTSKLILIAEAYSWSGSNTAGWYATQAIGFAGATAGAKFGGGAGIAPPMSKGALRPCDE